MTLKNLKSLNYVGIDESLETSLKECDLAWSETASEGNFSFIYSVEWNEEGYAEIFNQKVFPKDCDFWNEFRWARGKVLDGFFKAGEDTSSRRENFDSLSFPKKIYYFNNYFGFPLVFGDRGDGFEIEGLFEKKS
jgi:hypothetical protein